MASPSNDKISAWNLIFSSVPAMALKCALLLKIPDIISSAGPGPDAALSLNDIAARMEKPPNLDHLHRIMRYLSGIGVFKELRTHDETVYGLTQMTRSYFVGEGNPKNLAAFHLFMNEEVSQAGLHRLGESVAEGYSGFNIFHGKSIWDYANDDARYNRLLNDGMRSVTSGAIKDALEEYEGFKEVTTLVDVGGGVGEALREIRGVYPHINAINFDLPHVVAAAPRIAGITHVGGNMFESIPSADALFMKHVLHDWDDKHCVQILKNCFKSLPKNGKLILVEGVLGMSQYSNQFLQHLDLSVLALSNGGKERSQKQWIDLLGEVGFHIKKIIGREESLLKIIEAVKV